jgi:hypothetical protein
LPSGGASGNNNTGDNLIEGTLQDPGMIIMIRPAVPLDGNSGGLLEYIIPNGLKNGAISINKITRLRPPL